MNSTRFNSPRTSHHHFLPTKIWSPTWITFASFYLVIVLILIITGNLSTMIVLVDMRRHKKGIMNIYFLLSLATADLLVGLLVVPCTVDVVIHGEWRADSIMGYINAAGNVCFCISSIIHLALLSIDRYIAVIRPLRYQSILSSKRSAIICAISWVYSSLWALILGLTDGTSYECFIPYIKQCKPYQFYHNTSLIVVTVCTIIFSFGISSIVICVIYIHIYKIMLCHRKGLKSTVNLGRFSRIPCSSLDEVTSPDSQRRETNTRIQALRSQKGITIIFIIISLFLISWTPFCTVMVVECMRRKKLKGSWDIVTMFLGFGNSACNPLIYCMKFRMFRKTLWKLVRNNRLVISLWPVNEQRSGTS